MPSSTDSSNDLLPRTCEFAISHSLFLFFPFPFEGNRSLEASYASAGSVRTEPPVTSSMRSQGPAMSGHLRSLSGERLRLTFLRIAADLK